MNEVTEKRGRGRPRRAGAEETILTVVLAMLREKGYHQLTVDGVAEQTSIAKTTIYRRWPSKEALVAAALLHVAAERAPSPESGSFEGDLVHLLQEVVDLLHLAGEPAGNREVAEILRGAVAPDRERLAELLARRPLRADRWLVADLLLGPLLLGRTEVETIVRIVLEGVSD